MSERRRNAPTQRLTRRRDDDPVKVSKDHRVSWYPSGVPGKGDRKQKRCKNRAEAEAFALKKREEIDRHRTRGPLSHTALGDVWVRYVAYLRNTGTPQGTTDQYRSNWNCHMLESVAEISCGELTVRMVVRADRPLLAGTSSGLR